MPIYDYTCSSCRTDFDELVRSQADEQRLVCPRCGKKTVTRKPSMIAAPRSSAAATSSLPMGGCGRCGDPHGPCSIPE